MWDEAQVCIKEEKREGEVGPTWVCEEVVSAHRYDRVACCGGIELSVFCLHYKTRTLSAHERKGRPCELYNNKTSGSAQYLSRPARFTRGKAKLDGFMFTGVSG